MVAQPTPTPGTAASLPGLAAAAQHSSASPCARGTRFPTGGRCFPGSGYPGASSRSKTVFPPPKSGFGGHGSLPMSRVLAAGQDRPSPCSSRGGRAGSWSAAP